MYLLSKSSKSELILNIVSLIIRLILKIGKHTEVNIMVVQHNLTAMNTNRQLGIINGAQQKSTEKLSSGYRINRAGDDAAGLSISEKMRSQIRGLNKASNNAENGISLIQTAEGALNEVHSILQRMNELATQGANDVNTSVDRAAINKEIASLSEELTRIQEDTSFNDMSILDGDISDSKLQVGAKKGQTIEVKIEKLDTYTANTQGGLAKLGLSKNAKTDKNEQYGTAMEAIQTDIKKVSDLRSDLGAIQNRLEHTIANLDTTAENTQAAESLIRDVDMADEMVEFSKNQILAQAGQSMLAQANQANQGVLSLLQ
jgi:flagellin